MSTIVKKKRKAIRQDKSDRAARRKTSEKRVLAACDMLATSLENRQARFDAGLDRLEAGIRHVKAGIARIKRQLKGGVK